MPDNNIKIGVQISDNGSADQTNKNVKNVKDVLDQTTASANKATKAISAMNTAQAGGRATTAKIKQATGGDSGDARGMYAAQRGAIGTGAAGRDFSKESQGLGGLVRLYATFAANIYAVGAAFNALSQAMDTTNMVKGLDQLGAAQGRNLGSLAKQLVSATDGAISLRDALTATAQASSSGMSNEAILKLGNVAKKASQALGVAMPDAISRLSRGITKIEPELLDELGIFVKIDKATEDYARTVGKSASTLTDFERRQAFANAVLEEGSRKFAAINIDTNPYEKIAATFQNLIQSGLELVNKVLTPITTLFASSPTALAVTIALFAKSLLGQALPVLGRWKTGLADAAEAARQNVIATNKARQSLIGDISEKTVLDAVEAKKAALDRVDAGVARLQKVKGFAKTAALIPAGGLDEGSVKALEARSKAINDSYTKGQALTEKTIAAKKREEAAINSVTSAYREQALQEVKLQKILDENQTKISRSISLNAAANRIADAAAAKSQRVGIVSSVASEVSARGVSGSFEELNRQIALARNGKDALGKPFEDGQKKMSVFNAGLTRTIGTVTILTSALGTMASSLGIIGIIVATLVAVYEVLDAVFSTSGKEAKGFGESMDTLGSSVENVNRTIENINTKKLVDFFSVESTQAKANALADLSDSIDASVTKFQKLADAQSGWDKFFDSIFDFFGKGAGDKLADGLSQSIIAGISAIESPEAKAQFQEKIKGILNVSDADLVSAKALDSAIDKLTSDKKISSGKAIADAFVVVKENTAKAANNLVAFRDALTEGNKLVDTMNASLKPTDNLGKVGDVLINASFKLGVALKDPVNAFTAIKELVNNTKVLSLLPPEEGMRLAMMRNQVNQLAEDSARNEKALQEAIKRRIKLEEEYNAEKGKGTRASPGQLQGLSAIGGPLAGAAAVFADNRGFGVGELFGAARSGKQKEDQVKPYKDAFEAAQKAEQAIQRRKEEFELQKARLAEQEQQANLNIYKAGAKALEQSLKGAFAEGGIIVARGYLSLIAGAGGQTGVEEASLKQQEINIQIQNIKQIFENSQQLKRLTLAVEKDTIGREINRLKAEDAADKLYGSGTGLSAADKRKLETLTIRDEVISIVQGKMGPNKASSGYQDPRRTDLASAQDLADMELGSMQAEKVKMQGEVAKLYAQIEAIDIDKKIVIPLRNAAKLEKERLEYAANAITRKIEEEDRLISIVGVYSRELQARKDILAQDALANKYAQDTKDLLTSQQILQNALATKKLDTVGTAAAERTIEQNNVRLSEIKLSFEDKLAKLKQSQFIQDLQKTEELRKQEAARQGEILENSRQVQLSKLSIREAELGFLTATGRISEKAVANEQYQIALIKQQLDYERESLALANARLAVESEQRVKEEALALMPKTLTLQGDTDRPEDKIEITNSARVTAEAELTAQKQKQNALLDSQKEKLDAANVARTKAAQLTRDAQLETAATNKRLEEQAVAMEKIQSIAKTLGDAFGETGQKIATGIQAITTSLQDYTNKRVEADKKYAKDRLDIETKTKADITNIQESEMYVDTTDAVVAAKEREKTELTKLDDDYTNKSKRMSVDRDIAVVNSAKNMFKEKTGAYRALNAIERAMHVQKMFMMALELKTELLAVGKAVVAAFAGETQKTAATASGVAARNTAKVPGIFATFLEMLGPFGMAAAAVAIAAIGISKSGGPKTTGAFTPTSEQMQKVAGTGQKYDETGKLVSRTGGVPTDDTARAESVVKSLSYMEDHMSDDTKLSNKMLEALRAIKTNTEGLSSAVLSTFRAPNAGDFSGYGKTGTIKEGMGSNKLGSAIIGGAAGVGVAAIAGSALLTASIGAGMSAAFMAIGGPVALLIGALASQIPVVGKAISSIFGGKTTRDVTNFGIAVKGTVKEIAMGAEETIKQFVDIQTKRKGGWFRKDKITNETFDTEANDAIKGYVSALFTNQQILLKEAGKVLGRDTTLTDNIIDATEVAFRLSAKGISGEELTKAIEGEVSIAVNDAAEAAFPELAKFAKAFEEPGQTVLRVATNMAVLSDSLSNLGIVLPKLTEGVYSAISPELQADLDKAIAAKNAAQAEFDKISAGVDKTITETVDYEGTIYENTRAIATAEDATKAQAALTTAIAEYDKQAALISQAQNTRTTNNIAYQQEFVDLNGDIDTLNKRLAAYGANILTTGQRTEAAQVKYKGLVDELTTQSKTVTQETQKGWFTIAKTMSIPGNNLKEILEGIKTKEQFDQLFKNALTAGTKEGNEFATVLLKIAPAFAGLTELAEAYNETLEDQKVKMGALGIAGGLTPDEAKSLDRERQRIKISEEYTTVQAAELIANQNAIWQAEDRLDITKREIAIMSAQGHTYAVILENRRIELSQMTAAQQILQQRLYAVEDQNKTDALNVRLMEASGNATEALYARRVLELRSMSEADQEILRRIWLLEDEKKAGNDTTNLAIELMEAEGNSIGALNARRTQELKGLSLTAQEMKIRIWTLQDEKKVLTAKNAQELKIYELLGNASEVLRLQREAELESMDAALRPGQRYIYALQDQKTIYDKLKTAVSNTTTSLKTSIQTLKEYQFSLKTGDKTILKPAEVYALKKQEFFNLKAIAESVATTPAEEALQATAISKLPAAADAFLESSKTLFASGQAYTDDFNLIDSALTSLSGILTSQLSDAEKNLRELATANSFLDSIDESTKTTADLLAELIAANANVAITKAAAGAAGYTSAGGLASSFNTGTFAGIPGVQPVASTATGSAIPDIQQTTTAVKEKIMYWYATHPDQLDKNPLTHINPTTGMNALDYWVQEIARYGVAPAKWSFTNAVALNYGTSVRDVDSFGLPNEFARGGLASGLAIVGEEGPELVDFQTPGRVYPAGQTTAMLANNTALINEIKALRQEVEKLRSEQKEQTGHLITTNYDANRIAAEMLAKATQDASKEAAWANRSAAKIV